MQSIRSSVVLGVLLLEEEDVDADISETINRSLTSGAHSEVAYVDAEDASLGFVVSVLDSNSTVVSGPVTFTVADMLVVRPWDNSITLHPIEDFDPLFNSDQH